MENKFCDICKILLDNQSPFYDACVCSEKCAKISVNKQVYQDPTLFRNNSVNHTKVETKISLNEQMERLIKDGYMVEAIIDALLIALLKESINDIEKGDLILAMSGIEEVTKVMRCFDDYKNKGGF